MPYFLLALLAWPVLEIVAMIVFAKAFGAAMLLLWLLTAAVAGGLMLRHHKLAVVMPLFANLRQGRINARSLFWVARYYISAILLLLPGLIGDIVALVLLLPWPGKTPQATPTHDDGVIEGDFRHVKQPPDRPQQIDHHQS